MSSFAGCMSSVLSMALFPLLYVRLMRSFSRQECTSTLIDKDNASATDYTRLLAAWAQGKVYHTDSLKRLVTPIVL